ncbi:MAG: hypothetical protein AUJ08_00265 [Thaumarchaeota archaeon 13_1_40CM_3_50_5]|nr:MAG: hypothetical protein AUJ08_00265 [Thaumarchaeota archaeon 13_1_40CM_3_50_5]
MNIAIYNQKPLNSTHKIIASPQVRIALTIILSIMLFTPLMLPYLTSFVSDISAIKVQNAYAALPDFNFAAVGDWACGTTAYNTANNIVSKNTELTLGLGDYSYAKRADCWFSVISPIDGQTRINIGNHDVISNKLLNQYMTHFHLAKQFYSFDYQNVHILTMSTEIPFATGSEQYNFVKNDLASAASNPNINWIVVNFHRAMYLSDGGYGVSSSLKGYYHALFDQYNVDLVLNGHQHAYERTFPIKYNSANPSSPIVTDTSTSSYNDPQGEIFATVGTGGASMDNTFLNKAPFAATQFFDGTIGDQFTIDKSPSTTVVKDVWASSMNTADYINNYQLKVGEKITDVARQGVKLDDMTMYLKSNTTVGTLRADLIDLSTNALVAVSTNSIARSAITTTAYLPYTFTFPADTITPNSNFFVGLECVSCNSGKVFAADYKNGDPYPLGNMTMYRSGAWITLSKDMKGSATYEVPNYIS